MNPDSRLNTPPPVSQFRRPWSPDPYDPLPSNPLRQSNDYNPVYDYLQTDLDSHNWQQRRELSDFSVEAVDLADYSRTLRARESSDPYPPFNSPPFVPLRALPSRGSIHPPSPVSRVQTLTSNASSFPLPSRNPARRPFSLPPPSVQTNTSLAHRSRSPHSVQPHTRSVESDIDVSQFPPWSRNWYKSNNSVSRLDSPPDIYTPLPVSRFNPATRQSSLDPGYKQEGGPPDIVRSADEYHNAHIPPYPFGHDSTPNILPWSNDPLLDDNLTVDSAVKVERIRMLEREFGAENKSGNSSDIQDLDENGKPVIGSVDQKGKLVTQGPRKRITLRMLQIILTLTAGIPSIYAALIIKPKEAPPPSGKPPAFVLYILSVVTLLTLLHFFIFRPCCCPGKRRKSSPDDTLGGMMVFPVQSMPGGKGEKNKDRKKGKKGANNDQGKQSNVQVNLIVDPRMFRKDDDGESQDEEWNESIHTSAYGGGPGRRKRTPRRRSVFAGLAMEEDWKQARAFAKKLSILDVAGLTVWGAAFVFVLIGKRCPSGGFEGWCNAYNVSSAAACLLAVAFGVSTFFDVKDLHASKMSPRTRV